MPVTLAQAKLNAQSDIDANVIDEFRKSSWLLDNITFDDVVNPAGGGATLTYGYTRLITQPTAAFRAINAEYTPQEVTKQAYTVDLKPFGGSYQIDRVLAGIARGAEVAIQSRQKIKAAQALFADAFINGDVAVDANSFDGLEKALTGTTTELNTGVYADWTTIANQADAFAAMALLDELLDSVEGGATAILGNKRALAKVKAIARYAGYRSESEDAFGRKVENFDQVALIDLGDKPGASTPIVAIETRDVDGGGAGGNITGLTDIYAVRLGLDGVHGVALTGGNPVRNFLPDFNTPGAVKTGEVEMVAAVALKATKSAAVLKNIKVQ